MTSDRPKRKSLRAPGYDYTAPGTYVVTVCVEHRACVLGDVVAGVMILNDVGLMVDGHWDTLPARFPSVELDEYAILPNHMHGILRVGWDRLEETREGEPSPSLGRLMQWFKSITTSDYGTRVEQQGYAPYPGRFWQRNYFERIVRTERELEKHRNYIAGNAAKWSDDPLYHQQCRGFR